MGSFDLEFSENINLKAATNFNLISRCKIKFL